MEYLTSERAVLAIISHYKSDGGHCSQPTADDRQALLRCYCSWVLGTWDIQAEFKCFALSNLLLCEFTDSASQSWRCCLHNPLTSRFLHLYLVLTQNSVKGTFSVSFASLWIVSELFARIHCTQEKKRLLSWLHTDTTHAVSGKFISRKSSYLPVHLHCLSRLNSKSYDAEQGWRTVGWNKEEGKSREVSHRILWDWISSANCEKTQEER